MGEDSAHLRRPGNREHDVDDLRPDRYSHAAVYAYRGRSWIVRSKLSADGDLDVVPHSVGYGLLPVVFWRSETRRARGPAVRAMDGEFLDCAGTADRRRWFCSCAARQSPGHGRSLCWRRTSASLVDAQPVECIGGGAVRL